MKNKFSNLNILLILFLCLVGFSPQKSIITPVTCVYADTADSKDNSYTGTLTLGDFESQIGTTLGELNSNDGKESGKNAAELENITSGMTMFISVMGQLSTYMQGFAFAVSACIVAVTGIKIMNSGKRNVIQFIKGKKEISNALLCVVFITFIPFLVRGILEFKPPSFMVSSLDSSLTGNLAISDIVAKPKSGIVEYITNNKDLYKPTVTNGKNLANSITETSDDDKSWGDVIVEKICKGVLKVITFIIYSPLVLMTSIVGALGFYPVSFDVAMYNHEGEVVKAAKAFFETIVDGGVAGFAGTKLIEKVVKGLYSLTTITNLLYFIIKKFALVSVEFVCYYYGVMCLLGNDSDDVGKFLTRLAKGVIGITLFPFIVEFLLDVDGMISSSILRITGTSFPGFGVMSALPSSKQAGDGFTILVLSILMCAVVFSLAKTFFIRRIEITFYYIASPVFFLKDMMSSKGTGVAKLSKTMVSAIFLTTVYAPVLALINLMTTLAATDEEVGFIYYMLVIVIILMGKNIMSNIITDFAGGSASSASANEQFKKGLSNDNAIVKTAKGIAGTGAGFAGGLAAHGAMSAINNRHDLFKGAVDGAKSLKGQGFIGGAKTVGSAALRGTKNGVKSAAKNSFSAVKNKTKSEYWKKYNQLDKKYGNINHNLQMDTEKNKNEVEDRGDSKKQQLDLLKAKNNKINKSGQIANETIAELAKQSIAQKYPDDPVRAEKEYAKYQEVIKASGKHSDHLEKYKDFKKRGDTIANKSNSPKAIEAMRHYDRTLNELPTLHNELDTALKDGRVDDVFRINKDIERRQKFLAATETSVTSMRSATNAKVTRDSSLNTLQAIRDVRGNIQPPVLQVRDERSASNFVKSITAIPEIANNDSFRPMIQQMNSSLAQNNLGDFQKNVEQFALAQRNSGLSNQIKSNVNTELGRVLNVSPTRVREHTNVIKTGIDLNAGPQATEYYRQVDSASTSSVTAIADFIAVTSGTNATNYTNAQAGVVGNVLNANTTNDIVQTAQREAKLNNGTLDINSLHTIIRENGGTRTLTSEVSELKEISIKENEKFREASVNMPTPTEYGINFGSTNVTPEPTGEPTGNPSGGEREGV